MDMIERVARAMAENAGFAWEHCAQSQWKSDARAAIAAMRTPTDAQRNAYYELSHKTETFNDGRWERAIDAALSSEQSDR